MTRYIVYRNDNDNDLTRICSMDRKDEAWKLAEYLDDMETELCETMGRINYEEQYGTITYGVSRTEEE